MPGGRPTLAPMDPISCELLSIGSELLVGETVDTNAAYLGAELALLGLLARGARQLPDDRGVIAEAIRDARSRSALVVVTGGLGPTHDDLTREAIADALGEDLAEDPGLVAALERRFRAYGPMPAANRKQATLIRSAVPLDNPIGSAPGWWVERDGRVVVLLPGVPAEMRRMWREEVVSRVRGRFSLPDLHVRLVKTFGIGESALAERLAELLDRNDPQSGIYARDDGVHVRFTTRRASALLDDAVARALHLAGADAYGTDRDELPTIALSALVRKGVETVATWEADTQGALLAILAGVTPRDGMARFVGGLLDAGGAAAVPHADAVLQLSLSPAARTGRSQLEVSMSGMVSLPPRRVRIHGSGPQRLRRAAFAALDQVRRELT
jgi:nicotinamide-nucleotide amidase